VRWCLLLAIAACTVGASTTPPRTPTSAPPDTMPDEVLESHDAGRDYDRSRQTGGWLSGGNVCGGTCNRCHDVTRPEPPPGCLNQLACASTTTPSADIWFLALAIVIVARRRRPGRRPPRVRSAHEGDAVLEEHLNQLP
jgi:hypothetical protein